MKNESAESISALSLYSSVPRYEMSFGEQANEQHMCADPLDDVTLHFPPDLRKPQNLAYLDIDGVWKSAPFTDTDDGVTVHLPLDYCRPLYLKIS